MIESLENPQGLGQGHLLIGNLRNPQDLSQGLLQENRTIEVDILMRGLLQGGKGLGHPGMTGREGQGLVHQNLEQGSMQVIIHYQVDLNDQVVVRMMKRVQDHHKGQEKDLFDPETQTKNLKKMIKGRIESHPGNPIFQHGRKNHILMWRKIKKRKLKK